MPTVLACPACRTGVVARQGDPSCRICMKVVREIASRPAAMGIMQTGTPASPTIGLTGYYPAWHSWRGRDGGGRDADWHATRRRRLTAREAAAGVRITPSAAVPGSLRGLLKQQQVIEGLLALPAVIGTR